MAAPPLLERVTLASPRVRLVPLERDHIDAWWAASDDDTWRWTLVHPRSLDEMAAVVDAALALSEAGKERAWTTFLDDRVVGGTRFLNAAEWERRVEIGWTWLGPGGRGTVANPAAKLLQLTHAFEDRGCVRVELKTDVRNVRSQRAMEKMGAAREGVFRQHRRTAAGVWSDTVYYAITDGEWPAVKAGLITRIAATG